MRKPSYRTKEKAAEALGITVDVLDLIGRAAYGVYQEVGSDLAEANDGKPIKRDDLIEVCLDAGRPVQFLKQNLRYSSSMTPAEKLQKEHNTNAAIDALNSDNYLKLTAAMKFYFIYARYE